MTVSEITSTSNSVVKDACRLKQKKDRDESGLFLIEGAKMLREAVSSDMEVSDVFVEKSEYEAHREYFDTLDIQHLFVVSRQVIEKISEWKTPQGICAVVRKKEYSIDECLAGDSVFVLVLDGVSDPGNIGTIVRTAEAAGVKCIITTAGTADCYQSKALRASMGSIFRIRVFENFEKCGIIYKLKSNGIKIVSTSLAGQDVFDFDMRSKKVAAVFGNEGAGISDEFIQDADVLLRLPMEGRVESLNVAVSAGIIMYMIKMKN